MPVPPQKPPTAAPQGKPINSGTNLNKAPFSAAM